MLNFNAPQGWSPACSTLMIEIPAEHVVVRLENTRTREQAYYDVEKKRFLTQQEAFDAMNGYRI